MKELDLSKFDNIFIRCKTEEEYNSMIEYFKNKNIIIDEGVDFSKCSLYFLGNFKILYKSYTKYCDNKNYKVIEWKDYVSNILIEDIKRDKDFTKDMLEDFMIVETNEEENNRYIKIKNKLVQTKSFNNLNDYNNNLKYNTISEEDVIYNIQKVYKIKNICGFDYMLTDDSNLELIWERKEESPVEYTLEELEQKLGQKIKIVNK